MKQIITIIISLFLASCGQDKTKGLSMLGLNGKVRSYEENSYRANKELGAWVRDPTDTIYYPSVVFFDENGNPTHEQKWNIISSKFYDRTKYEYEDGTIKRILIFNDDNALIETDNVIKAKPDFEILELVVMKKPYISLYEKDTTYFPNDTIMLEWKNGKPINSISSKGAKSIIEYNDKGFPILQKSYDKKGKEGEVTIYEYLETDKSNNWTRQVLFSAHASKGYITERKITYYQ